MKRIALILLISVLFLSGCSLEYGSQFAQENIDYYKSKFRRHSFANGYAWDGDFENTAITVPDKADGYKVVGLGGYFGRGVSCPFQVDFPENYELANTLDPNADINELTFSLDIGKNVENINFWDYSNEVYYNRENGEYFKITFSVECSDENGEFFSSNGKLYYRSDKKEISSINYKTENN